ncbi:uncharacterized protein LOC144326428 [Podarcis muralis]
MPSTSAALFNDTQSVRTRSQSRASASGSRARGGKATSKSTRNNNSAAPSSSNRSQDKRPRAQSPDSEASSAAEDAQQEEEGAATAATAEKPSGKRREKKKHTCRKSRSRRDDSDDDTGTSSSEYDSDASLGSYWGKGEEISGLPDWALSRRANSHRKKFGGSQEWKDGALVKDATSSTYSTSDVIPGEHLSPKLRAKILNGEFVDMFKLVPPAEELGRGEKRPSHGKRKSKYPSVPRTFENWLDGFQAFMGTIVAAYPKRAVHLVAYLSHIRTACALSGEAAAISYDKKFRRKASRIPLARWDQIENGIWSVAVGPYVEKRPVDAYRSARKGGSSPFVGAGGPIIPVPGGPPQQGTDGEVVLGLAFSPIKLVPLCNLLSLYPDKDAASYLREGFSSGFRIPIAGSLIAKDSPNQKSVRERPEVAERKIAKEVSAGRVAGPFDSPPIPNLHISPLGIVPKKTPGEFRLIHNLSFPKGGSVNDAIPPELCTVKYATFDQAVKLIRSFGPGALLAKCDIESAFRLLPVHPADFRLLGFKFQGKYYVDRAMPMGCAVACSAFEAFSTFLDWALRFRANTIGVTHYLDDFLFVGGANTGECASLLEAFSALAEDLGVPLAAEKTEGPATRLTYLGIELDTVAQSSRLPVEKIAALKQLIQDTLKLRKITLRQIQSLLGHFNFACRVVSPGRPFCARLARLSVGLKHPLHRVRLPRSVKADLEVWTAFLEKYNGVSLWQDVLNLSSDFQVQSDAAGSLGFGLYFKGRWCAQRWPSAWQGQAITRDLTFLEFFPIVVAVHIWTEEFRDHRVCFRTDNLAVVNILARQSSRSARVSSLLRAFVLRCLEYNILFSAKFVPGANNDIADALSRFQIPRFRSLAPGAQLSPEPFPEYLWNVGDAK